MRNKILSKIEKIEQEHRFKIEYDFSNHTHGRMSNFANTSNPTILVSIGTNSEEFEPECFEFFLSETYKKFNSKATVSIVIGDTLFTPNLCALYGFPPSLAEGGVTFVPQEENETINYENTFRNKKLAKEALERIDAWFITNIALFLTPEITTSLASHYNIDCKSANLTQEVITSLKGENNPNSTIELINQYRKQHNIRPLVHWHDQESNTVEQAESLCQAFLKDTAKKLGETWFLKNRHLFLSEQIIKFMLTELKALIDKKDSVTTKENMLRLINKLPSNFPPEKDQVIEILNKLSFDEQKYLINKCSEKVSGNSIQVLGWDDFEKKVNNNTNENQSIQKISAACIARPSFQNTMSQFAKAYNRRMLKHIQTFHQYKDKKPQIINATFKLLDLDSADLLANIKSDTAQACATLYGKKESFYLAAASNCKFDAFLYPAGDLSSVVDTAMSIAKETYNLESIPFINTTWVDAPLEELPKQEKKDSHPIPMQQDVSANFRFFPSNSSSPPNNVTEHNKHSDSEIHNSNMPSPPQSLPSLQKLPPLCQVRGKTKINFDDFDSVEHIVNLMTAVAQRRYTLDTAALFCPYWLTTDDFVIAGKKMDDWYQNESNQYFTNMASTLYLEQLNLKREKGKRSTSGPPFNKVIKERKDSERKKERSIETLDITKTPSSSSN